MYKLFRTKQFIKDYGKMHIGELGHLNRKHLDSLCKNIF